MHHVGWSLLLVAHPSDSGEMATARGYGKPEVGIAHRTDISYDKDSSVFREWKDQSLWAGLPDVDKYALLVPLKCQRSSTCSLPGSTTTPTSTTKPCGVLAATSSKRSRAGCVWSSKCQAFRGDSFCLPQSLTWFEVSNDAGYREDIHLSIKDNLLTLSALKPQTRREEGGFYHQTERHFGRFYRRILLPYNVDADNVKAHMDGGVLKVTPRGSRLKQLLGADLLFTRPSGPPQHSRQSEN